MAGTSGKKRKGTGPAKLPLRGNPQKERVSGEPRRVEKATAGDCIGAARLRSLPLAVTPVLGETRAAIIADRQFHWGARPCVAVSLQAVSTTRTTSAATSGAHTTIAWASRG